MCGGKNPELERNSSRLYLPQEVSFTCTGWVSHCTRMVAQTGSEFQRQRRLYGSKIEWTHRFRTSTVANLGQKIRKGIGMKS